VHRDGSRRGGNRSAAASPATLTMPVLPSAARCDNSVQGLLCVPAAPVGTVCCMHPDLARQIATAAHAGQVDKAGAPYIDHPARVARRVAATVGDEHPAVAVAWLHDVVEDTDVTFDDLAAAGLDLSQTAALAALTHRPGESRSEYIDRVTANELAVLVKRADIADNTDPQRLAALDPDTVARLEAKYARDLSRLDR
jgi:hypothetical protein